MSFPNWIPSCLDAGDKRVHVDSGYSSAAKMFSLHAACEMIQIFIPEKELLCPSRSRSGTTLKRQSRCLNGRCSQKVCKGSSNIEDSMKNPVSRKNGNSVKPAVGDGSLAADSPDDQRSSKGQESAAHEKTSSTF